MLTIEFLKYGKKYAVNKDCCLSDFADITKAINCALMSAQMTLDGVQNIIAFREDGRFRHYKAEYDAYDGRLARLY